MMLCKADFEELFPHIFGNKRKPLVGQANQRQPQSAQAMARRMPQKAVDPRGAELLRDDRKPVIAKADVD